MRGLCLQPSAPHHRIVIHTAQLISRRCLSSCSSVPIHLAFQFSAEQSCFPRTDLCSAGTVCLRKKKKKKREKRKEEVAHPHQNAQKYRLPGPLSQSSVAPRRFNPHGLDALPPSSLSALPTFQWRTARRDLEFSYAVCFERPLFVSSLSRQSGFLKLPPKRVIP